MAENKSGTTGSVRRKKEDDGERLVKLALYVREQGPVDFGNIRAHLKEYAPTAGSTDAVRRKFERDKASLASCGIYFETDENDCYSMVAESSYALPVDLTASEASMLRTLCSALMDDPAYPFKNDLRMILVKISDELEIPDLLTLANGNDRKDVLPAGFKKVQRAITARKRLSFGYRDAHGASSSREVEPFGCFVLDTRCYFAAYDPAIEEERLFRLDRTGAMKVNSSKPQQTDFDARPFDTAAWYRLPFQFGPDEFEATLSFANTDAWRAQHLCMQRGSFEETASTLLWHIDARSIDGLVRWCIENGPGVVPVAPEALCTAYRASIERALEVCHG